MKVAFGDGLLDEAEAVVRGAMSLRSAATGMSRTTIH